MEPAVRGWTPSPAPLLWEGAAGLTPGARNPNSVSRGRHFCCGGTPSKSIPQHRPSKGPGPSPRHKLGSGPRSATHWAKSRH